MRIYRRHKKYIKRHDIDRVLQTIYKFERDDNNNNLKILVKNKDGKYLSNYNVYVGRNEKNGYVYDHEPSSPNRKYMKFDLEKGDWIIAAGKKGYITVGHELCIDDYTRLIFTLERI